MIQWYLDIYVLCGAFQGTWRQDVISDIYTCIFILNYSLLTMYFSFKLNVFSTLEIWNIFIVLYQ